MIEQEQLDYYQRCEFAKLLLDEPDDNGDKDISSFEALSNTNKLLVIEEYLRNIAGVDGYIIDIIGDIARS